MIYLEELARELDIEGAVRVKGLEAITGADMMLSRIRIPPNNRALILKHVQAGALLVQCKIGDDLSSSIGDRLNESLARMIECNARQAQCVLLFIGVITCDIAGKALINGRKTHNEHDYRAVKRAMSKWTLRGGVVQELSRESLLPDWCADQIKMLDECFEHPLKHIYQIGTYPDSPPVDDDPIQLPVRVKDGRLLLIQLPGLGIELVERVWNHTGSLKAALNFLTDATNAGHVEGVGAGKINKIRHFFGMNSDEGAIQWWAKE